MSNVEKKVTFTALMKGFDKATSEVRSIQQAVEDAAQSGTPLSDVLKDITKSSQGAEKAIQGAKTALSGFNTEAKSGAKEVSKNVDAWSKWAQAATKFKVEAQGAAKAAKETAQGGKNYQNLGGLMDEGILERRNQAMSFSTQLQARMNTEQKYLVDTGKALDANMVKQADTFQRLNTETNGMAQGSLPRLRYALYDVSTTLAIAGAAMLGLATATAAVSIKMERQFADVLRTTESYMDSTGQAGRRLRDDFNDLFTSLPVSWDALTEIGTLAGQLGVAQEDVAEFTELVAKFGATSDVTVEQAATAFGRLSELLDVPAAKYENLGSSILSVGIASVATEGQIINTTTQLAAIGNFAGLSASEVVGLSSALASLGTQPELSRGSMTRLFTKISEAVSEGGEKLAQFADLSKMSASQFASAWNNEPIKAIEAFLAGVGDQGENAVSALKELGITSVRDIPTLLRLGQNIELVSEQIAIAGQGFEEGTSLQEQYGVIAETVSAKLEVMKNSVTNLFSTLGEGANVIGPVIDMITGIINALNRFIDNPIGEAIAGITLAVTALGGAILLLLGGVARGTASMAAMITALNEIGVAGGRATFSLGALTGAMNAAGISTRATTLAVNGLKTALLTSGIGIAVLAIGAAFQMLNGQARYASNVVDEFGSSIKDAMLVDTQEFEKLKDAGQDVGDSFHVMTVAAKDTEEAVKPTRAEAENLANSLVGLGDDSGVASEEVGTLTEKVGDLEIALADASDTAIRVSLRDLILGEDNDSGTEVARVEEITAALESVGLTMDDLAEGVRTGDLPSALAELTDQLNFENVNADQVGIVFDKFTAGSYSANLGVLNFIGTVEDLRDKTIETASKLANATAVSEMLGIAVEGAAGLLDEMGGEFGDLGSEADIATAALKEFMEMAFGAANAEIAMNQAMSNLGASLYENGNAFDTFSTAGQANLQALQAAFQAAGEQAVQDGYSYELGIQTVAQAMVQAGVISVQQLEALGVQSTNFGNNLLSVAEATSQAVAALQDQMTALRAADSGLTRGQAADGLRYAGQAIDVINRGGGQAETAIRSMGIEFDRLKPPASAVNDLIKQLGMGWDDADQKARKAGGSGSKAAKDTGKAAKDAAKEVRTLSDYVSDLGSVMSAAFDFRFGFQSAKDDSLTAFRAIQKSFEDARLRARDLRLEIRDLKAEMQQGRADINVLSYQLTVAQEYGDTLREEQIRAELAKATADLAKQNADLADKQKDLNKAVADGTPDVTSNTDAAIGQRDAVLSLVSAYQSQIEQYAATGASQKGVENYSKQLTRQFEAQMRQLGYSREETRKYGLGLKDFTEIIKAVPRDLTVSVSTSTSAAEKAIREFTAKKRSTTVDVKTPSSSSMKKAGSTAANNYRSGFGGLTLPKPKVPTPDPVRIQFKMPSYSQMMKMQAHIRKITNNPSFRIALPGGQGGQTFADGGYTGRGGKHEEAGIVHRGEYVVKKELVDQRTGLPKADAFGQLVAGTPTPASSYANGGFVNPAYPTSVDLSPMSIQQIARAVQPYLVVDGRVVGEVTSNQFAQGTRVGAN